MANFVKLETAEQLDAVFARSANAPVVLFKHSVTCPISTGVFSEVSGFAGDVNLVVVQTARDISNEIARRTGVRHESPQAIVIKNGQPAYHASHYDITAADIENSVN